MEVDSGPAVVRDIRLKRLVTEDDWPALPMTWEQFVDVVESFSNTTTRVPLSNLTEPTG